MCKYRLKRWYPTLPKTWELGFEIITASNGFPYYVGDTLNGPAIPKKDVEENPDYWEKVVNKES